MKKTRRVKRKPYGTLRKSRRYRRGGYAPRKMFSFSPFPLSAVRHGGKKRRTKRKSSRRKRGGAGTTHHTSGRLFYASRASSVGAADIA